MKKEIFEVKQIDRKGEILGRLFVETTNAIAALLTFKASIYHVTDPSARLVIRLCH